MRKKELINGYVERRLSKTKAFTLIELLAIIIILAIIAVITVPVILDVIDNAKKGSIIDSAYGYKDAVDKYYFAKLMEEDFELDDTYSVSDGKLGGIDIPFTGTGPINGYLIYENSELESGCLTFDVYKVTYDGSKFTSEKGTCPKKKAITYTDSNGVKYYNTEWIGENPVYYNPVTGQKCNVDNTNGYYHEDNSKTGYNGITTNGSETDNTDNNNGCLKWYAYSEQNGNVNLLLDHNTTATLYWNFSFDINGSNADGPSTDDNQLLGKLKSDTGGWVNSLIRSDRYSMKVEKTKYPIDYTIDYSGYKARIISAQEIAYITGNELWDETSTSSREFHFDNNRQSISSTPSYGWLYDRTSLGCDNRGCINNSDVFKSSYWTVSSSASNSNSAWFVNDRDYFENNDVSSNGNGVRPVITILKSSIFEN